MPFVPVFMLEMRMALSEMVELLLCGDMTLSHLKVNLPFTKLYSEQLLTSMKCTQGPNGAKERAALRTIPGQSRRFLTRVMVQSRSEANVRKC